MQEQRALGFPGFARGVGTAPPAPLLKVVGVDVPVRLSEPLPSPWGGDGDDDDGVENSEVCLAITLCSSLRLTSVVARRD